MASQSPFPLMPPRSTQLRMDHFDEEIYDRDPDQLLYKIIDALCGTSGAGSMITEALLARMGSVLDTIYFNELDFIFGKISFLGRSSAESYPYKPLEDMLDSDAWDEVRIKDAWYRTRIKEFFQACNKGSSVEGIRATVHAALGVDTEVFEVWRYADNAGLVAELGRANSARNEVVVRPHKDTLAPQEVRLARDMLAKIMSVETITTIDTDGLAVTSPLTIASACADSTYYEVQKKVIATPDLDELPPAEQLPINLLESEKWMFKNRVTDRAPYVAFNATQESSQYYLAGIDTGSPIDSITYGTLQPDGSVKKEADFSTYETHKQYTDWVEYPKADSPDNYPGGKYGINPRETPARNPDKSPYEFDYDSQADFVAAKKQEVTALGGIVSDTRFRLPITGHSSSKVTYMPDYAVARSAPSTDSAITASVTRRRGGGDVSGELRDPAIFARST